MGRSSASSPLSALAGSGEGVSMGPVGGNELEPVRERPFGKKEWSSMDGAGVCCCFGGNWNCWSWSELAIAVVVEGSAWTTDSDFLEKKPKIIICDGG